MSDTGKVLFPHPRVKDKLRRLPTAPIEVVVDEREALRAARREQRRARAKKKETRMADTMPASPFEDADEAETAGDENDVLTPAQGGGDLTDE